MSEISKSTKGVPAATGRADDVEEVKDSPPQDQKTPKRRKNVKHLRFSMSRLLLCNTWMGLAVLQFACSLLLFQLPALKENLIEVPSPDGNNAMATNVRTTGNKTVFSRNGKVIGTASANPKTAIVMLTDCFLHGELHGPTAKFFGKISLWFYGAHMFASIVVIFTMIWTLRIQGTVNYLVMCEWTLVANLISFSTFELAKFNSLNSKQYSTSYQSRGADLTYYFFSGKCNEYITNGCVSFVEFFMLCNCTLCTFLLLRQLRTRIRSSGAYVALKLHVDKDNKQVKRASK